MKRYLSIEIGHYRIKLAYMEQGILKQYLSERIDAEFPADLHLYAEMIKDLKVRCGIRCKNVIFVLPPEETYVKRFSFPLITIEQLNLNLPYEFGDYTGEDPSAYQFDYAVLNRKENEMDLLAAACKKELCEQYKLLAKLAKLKLTGLVPAVIGMERILNQNKKQSKKDAAILDLGTNALRIHFFREGIYDTTHMLESGCRRFEEIFQEAFDSSDSLLTKERQTIAVQIMRALRFYRFYYSQQTLEELYYCGGGACYSDLLAEIEKTLQIPLVPVQDLFWAPDLCGLPEYIDSPQTIGVLLP